MSYRPMIAVSAAVTAALAGVAAWAQIRLPADTQLPIHWDAAGQPDRLADAGTALFLPVLIAVALTATLAIVPRIEPMQRDMERSRPLFLTAWTAVMAIMVVVEAMTAAPAFGYAVPPTLLVAALGAMLVAIGNMLPKSRPGFFVGIRTPWAIIDEDNWIATHRIGARMMTGAGLVVMLAAVLPLPSMARTLAVTGAIAAAVVVPVAYSFLHWRRAAAG